MFGGVVQEAVPAEPHSRRTQRRERGLGAGDVEGETVGYGRGRLRPVALQVARDAVLERRAADPRGERTAKRPVDVVLRLVRHVLVAATHEERVSRAGTAGSADRNAVPLEELVGRVRRSVRVPEPTENLCQGSERVGPDTTPRLLGEIVEDIGCIEQPDDLVRPLLGKGAHRVADVNDGTRSGSSGDRRDHDDRRVGHLARRLAAEHPGRFGELTDDLRP